jgi:sugar transferase (PEP-CTERM/EpsH1 system associated)
MTAEIRYPRKVLHLVQGLDVGGLEYMVVALVNRLDRKKFIPSICCFDKLGKLQDKLLDDTEVILLKRKPGKDLLYPFKLAAFLKKENIDVIHLHNQTAFFYGVLAGKIAGVKRIVYTEHARDVAPNFKVRIMDKILSHMADRIVVVAEFLKKNLVKKEWMNPASITTIYNGIDGDVFGREFNRDEITGELEISSAAKIIGIVARLQGIKNHKCLIRAMQKVSKRFPDAILLIIGDGSLRGELMELVSSEDLQDNIHFLGTRNDIPRLLSMLDIFVLCSLSEGLPLTILEAMAAGKPIVATGVGGIPEVIQDGADGIIIPSDDSDSLAEAIEELLSDDGKRPDMGLKARKKFEERFTVQAMVEEYEKIYEGKDRTED